MIEFFGIPIDDLTRILLIITCCIVGMVAVLALLNGIFFKMGFAILRVGVCRWV